MITPKSFCFACTGIQLIVGGLSLLFRCDSPAAICFALLPVGLTLRGRAPLVINIASLGLALTIMAGEVLSESVSKPVHYVIFNPVFVISAWVFFAWQLLRVWKQKKEEFCA